MAVVWSVLGTVLLPVRVGSVEIDLPVPVITPQLERGGS